VETRTSGSEAPAGETGGLRRSNRAPARPYAQKVREAGRIQSVAALVATGVNAAGFREILGLDLVTSEDGLAGSPSSGSSWRGDSPVRAS